MARYSSDDIINGYVKRLLRAGWSVWRGRRHMRVQDPTGRLTLTVPGTASDRRAAQNWFTQVRRAARVASIPLPPMRDEDQ
jgi:hypothetical protein